MPLIEEPLLEDLEALLDPSDVNLAEEPVPVVADVSEPDIDDESRQASSRLALSQDWTASHQLLCDKLMEVLISGNSVKSFKDIFPPSKNKRKGVACLFMLILRKCSTTLC